MRLSNATASRVACGSLLLVALTACGDRAPTSGDAAVSAPEATAPAEPAPPVRMEDDEVLVSCGGNEGWPPSVMAAGVPGLLSPDEARATFRGILDDPQLGVEAELSILSNGVGTPYRVLRGDAASLTLGLGTWTENGPAARDTYVLDLMREGDRWVAGGWGSCANLGPVLHDGETWARVTRYVEVDPTSVTISVTELQCTGSRDPDAFLREPVVSETDDAVTVYVTSEPFEGDATCPGNPTVERDLELAVPLGSRRVQDGSLFPPQPVAAR